MFALQLVVMKVLALLVTLQVLKVAWHVLLFLGVQKILDRSFMVRCDESPHNSRCFARSGLFVSNVNFLSNVNSNCCVLFEISVV